MAEPIQPPISRPAAAVRSPVASEAARLRAAAEELESAFLAEMLKAAGVGRPRDSFGGGAGEEQFAPFLGRAQAEAMVKSGGIGLAEAIFEALKERVDVVS